MKPIDTMNLIRGTMLGAKATIDRLTARAEFHQMVNTLAGEFNEESNRDIQRLMDDTVSSDEDKYNISLDTNWDGVTISVNLVEGQSISEIKPLLRKIVRTRLFHPASYIESEMRVGWVFKTLDMFNDNGYSNPRSLSVNVFFKDSGVCKMQPTGKMIPEMKVVCTDGLVVDKPTDDTAKLAETED